MSRIPQEVLDRIRQEVDLVALVRARGVELKPTGENYLGLCPFHDDHNPSLSVSPKKNLWNCLGACGEGGGVIDWVMKADGLSFRHAVEVLLENHSILFNSNPVVQSRATIRHLECPVDLEADEQGLLNQVSAYYHTTLKKSPEALAYLKKRGIFNETTLDTFQLGYADRTLGLRLPTKGRKEGALIREHLIKAGIYRKSGHEHLTGSLVVPIIDRENNVKQLYGRKIRDDLRKGTLFHLYLSRPHTTLFNPQCLESEEIILCECLLDALSFIDCGIFNVTCAYGINNFKKDVHLKVLIEHRIKSVKIAYDRDDSGEEAALSLAENVLIPEGIECWRVKFPLGMDANQFACQFESSEEKKGELLRLLNSVEWMGKGESHKVPAATAKETMPEALDSVANAQKINVPTEVKGEEIFISLGERQWRVCGLYNNLSFGALKVTLRLMHHDFFHLDSLDLCNSKQRSSFIKMAVSETGLPEDTIKRDLGRVLLKLEELQAENIEKRLEPKKEKVVSLSEKERKEALEFLKSPDLLRRIINDFERCGVIGEEINKIVAYLAATSRKLKKPLGVIIQSSSAAGKSALMDAVLDFIPEEERVKYSAMTGQSLFYMESTNLEHKILAIAEEEGAEKATYPLKLLQSEAELNIASTGKDPKSGRLVTQEYHVKGPVSVLSTTTEIDMDEEYLNRCLILSIDEGREQTEAIHQRQRESYTLEGLYQQHWHPSIMKLHQNMQRLLRPLPVINPYSRYLTFLNDRTRTRRDHLKYLNLIVSITLLHQYQRPLKKDERTGLHYIETSLEDIAIANCLAHEVLGRCLDELSPQTRNFLQLLYQLVSEESEKKNIELHEVRFTRRQVRQHTGWSEFQVRKHINKLTELEYVVIRRSPHNHQFVYELLYGGQGEDSKPFLMGLIQVERLATKLGIHYDGNLVHFFRGCEYQNGESEPQVSSDSAPVEPPVCKEKIVSIA